MSREARDADLLAIGDAAARAGLRPSTLRYYEEAGLIEPAARLGGRRHYAPSVLSQLAVIALLQQSGFRLAEIGELLRRQSTETGADGDADRGPGGPEPVGLGEPGGGTVWVEERWRAMAERKLEELDARIAQLKDARRLLEEALSCGCCELDGCQLVMDAGARRADGLPVHAPHED